MANIRKGIYGVLHYLQSLAVDIKAGWCFFLLTLVLLTSGAEGSEARSDRGSPLQLSVSTDRPTYSPGQPVHLTLTLTNLKDTELTLSFRSSHQYDFVIKQGDQEVWRWSHERMFAQVLTQIHLKPHETRMIQATWDQKDREGKQVPLGSYGLLGLLLAEAKTHRAATSLSIAEQESRP